MKNTKTIKGKVHGKNIFAKYSQNSTNLVAV